MLSLFSKRLCLGRIKIMIWNCQFCWIFWIPHSLSLPFRVFWCFLPDFLINHSMPRIVARSQSVTCDCYSSSLSLGNEAWIRFCSDLTVGKLELSPISWQHSWQQIISLMAWIWKRWVGSSLLNINFYIGARGTEFFPLSFCHKSLSTLESN